MPTANKAEPTIDEVIATLNHSSLPTLVIEGTDDIIIFRRLEEQSENLTLSVLPVGGRKTVLALFDRLAEIKSEQAIAFVADRDLYVFTAIPAEYTADNLIFTEGYSIENDAFRDIDCERLLDATERQTFIDEMKRFSHWYALAVSRAGAKLKTHPSRILDNAVEWAQMTQLNPAESYPQDIYDSVIADYNKLIRGKSLFELFLRRMHGGRPAQHNKKALMEMAATAPGPYIRSLFDRAEALLVT
ncbi:DUF4435 domain-containing protein [Bradyrhizobium sp. CW1]|uniref:DUF4435 domain-containing protein n=1 Tax=Bradyrhizobium sp. CW1 TaxID=2782686 RepID=UPI001FFF00A6|nr:DUF4435 domain-containing protein [Bradyrhizobium sp. CW1]UPJ25887.1 DUF4435 domain-containing protein [Bradyrhizobium sp. CW1]